MERGNNPSLGNASLDKLTGNETFRGVSLTRAKLSPDRQTRHSWRAFYFYPLVLYVEVARAALVICLAYRPGKISALGNYARHFQVVHGNRFVVCYDVHNEKRMEKFRGSTQKIELMVIL